AKIDNAADQPSQACTQRAAEHSHAASLDEEYSLHVAIAGSQGFHDANFAPPLQDRHHQSIHDTQRGHGQGEAAEDDEEHIHEAEDLGDVLRSIVDGESIKAQLLDLVFHSGHVLALGNAHHQSVVAPALAAADQAAHVVGQ